MLYTPIFTGLPLEALSIRFLWLLLEHTFPFYYLCVSIHGFSPSADTQLRWKKKPLYCHETETVTPAADGALPTHRAQFKTYLWKLKQLQFSYSVTNTSERDGGNGEQSDTRGLNS